MAMTWDEVTVGAETGRRTQLVLGQDFDIEKK